MGELNIAVEMLDKLRPKVLKRIVLSLLIIGMVYIQFFDLPPAFKITIKEIMISTIGLATLFFIWFDYYFSVKTYRKYQDKLIRDGIIPFFMSSALGPKPLPFPFTPKAQKSIMVLPEKLYSSKSVA